MFVNVLRSYSFQNIVTIATSREVCEIKNNRFIIASLSNWSWIEIPHCLIFFNLWEIFINECVGLHITAVVI